MKATTDGNAFPPDIVIPSEDGIRIGFPPIITEAPELLVPRSMPMIFAINCKLFEREVDKSISEYHI